MTRSSPTVVMLVVVMAAASLSGRLAATLRHPQAPANGAAPPHRIVSVVPAITEMLFAMGAGEAVVGVSSYDEYPPAVRSLPRVGALVDPDFERILSLRPDLVIVYDTQRDLIARLDEVHVPMFTTGAGGGIADIMATIRRLGRRTGHTAEAERTADGIARDIEAVRREVAGRARPRTALVIGRDPGVLRGIFVSAGVGFMHDMLEDAGGSDVFGDIKRQNVQASTEMLLARAPDVVIEVHPSGEGTPDDLARARRAWAGLPALPAVQSGRVYILADNRLVIPGPRIAQAVRLLAQTLQGVGSVFHRTGLIGDRSLRSLELRAAFAPWQAPGAGREPAVPKEPAHGWHLRPQSGSKTARERTGRPVPEQPDSVENRPDPDA